MRRRARRGLAHRERPTAVGQGVVRGVLTRKDQAGAAGAVDHVPAVGLQRRRNRRSAVDRAAGQRTAVGLRGSGRRAGREVRAAAVGLGARDGDRPHSRRHGEGLADVGDDVVVGIRAGQGQTRAAVAVDGVAAGVQRADVGAAVDGGAGHRAAVGLGRTTRRGGREAGTTAVGLAPRHVDRVDGRVHGEGGPGVDDRVVGGVRSLQAQARTARAVDGVAPRGAEGGRNGRPAVDRGAGHRPGVGLRGTARRVGREAGRAPVALGPGHGHRVRAGATEKVWGVPSAAP